MSLPAILRRGVRAIVFEGIEEFRGQLAEAGQPEELVEVARQLLTALPDTLVSLNQLVWDDEAPLVCQALFPVVVSYLLREADLIPAHRGQLLLGLMDDAYLVYRAAELAGPDLAGVDQKDIGGYLVALRILLAEPVRSQLDALLSEALEGTGAGALV